MSDTATAADQMELIAFRIGEQEFCVNIMAVREIRGWTQVTPLPRCPAYVVGVINLRGAVLPIVDLAVRFGLPATQVSQRHVIIVVQIGNQVIGLLVDAVSDIQTVSESALQPPPDLASSGVRSFVQGLLAIQDRMLSMISLDLVLPRQEAEAA